MCRSPKNVVDENEHLLTERPRIMSNFPITNFLILIFFLVLIGIMPEFLTTNRITSIDIAINLFNAAILSIFMVWLIPQLNLRKNHLIVFIWLTLFIVQNFNNMIEAYFFTSVFSSVIHFFSSVLISLVVTFLEGIVIVSLLVTKNTGNSITESIKTHISSRSRTSWIMRVTAASLAYFFIFFLFGAPISPFIMKYYSDPALGLTIPPPEIIIPLEIFRGFVYAVTLLPVVALIRSKKKFLTIALILFVPGAFIPLVSNVLTFPIQIIPFHMVEILADSLVYGFVLYKILDRQYFHNR